MLYNTLYNVVNANTPACMSKYSTSVKLGLRTKQGQLLHPRV
jgi:hypothetical protein